jgi:hypothetical protein
MQQWGESVVSPQHRIDVYQLFVANIRGTHFATDEKSTCRNSYRISL